MTLKTTGVDMANGTRTRRFLAVAGCLVVAGLGVLIVKTASPSATQPRPGKSARPALTAWQALARQARRVPPGESVVDASFERQFPIATEPQTPLPVKLERKVAAVLGRPLGPFPYSVRVGTPRGPLWIEATRTVVCLVRESGALTCAVPFLGRGGLTKEGLTVGTSVMDGKRRKFRLSGLVPAGVAWVRVKAGRRRYRVPVADHVFDTEASAPIGVAAFIRR